MKIGIMGGTFNPIHNGHLILSEYIREEVDLDKIIFIPAGIPPHKLNQNILDKNMRKEMVDLAIKSNNKFGISTIEIDAENISYTIDTITKLKEIYEKDKLFMIIGGDSLLELHQWKDYQNLLTMINFIVADRRGSIGTRVIDKIEEYNKKLNANIIRVHSPIIEISSTNIRERVKKGLSIKYLVPEEVEEYIISNRLYK